MPRRTKNPSKSWTANEIKSWIREQTEKANKIASYYMDRKEWGLKDKRYDRQINKLQRTVGQKRYTKKKPIATKLNKTKEALLKQAKGLQSFLKFTEKTEFAEEFDKEKVEIAYRSFKRNRDRKMSKEEYGRLATTLGAARGILSDFGYEAGVPSSDNEMIVGNIRDLLKKGLSKEEIIETMELLITENDKKPDEQKRNPTELMNALDDMLDALLQEKEDEAKKLTNWNSDW